MSEEKERVVTIRYNPTSTLNVIINLFSAMVSWYFNHSLLWAAIHYIFGPFYLIYCLFSGRFADGGLIDIFNSYF